VDVFGPQAANASTYDQSGPMPDAIRAGFASAMGQSLLLPAGVLVIGLIAVLFFARPVQTMRAPTEAVGAGVASGE
jgi:hypothetical protein